jgi:hypothetical protein
LDRVSAEPNMAWLYIGKARCIATQKKIIVNDTVAVVARNAVWNL